MVEFRNLKSAGQSFLTRAKRRRMPKKQSLNLHHHFKNVDAYFQQLFLTHFQKFFIFNIRNSSSKFWMYFQSVRKSLNLYSILRCFGIFQEFRLCSVRLQKQNNSFVIAIFRTFIEIRNTWGIFSFRDHMIFRDQRTVNY